MNDVDLGLMDETRADRLLLVGNWLVWQMAAWVPPGGMTCGRRYRPYRAGWGTGMCLLSPVNQDSCEVANKWYAFDALHADAMPYAKLQDLANDVVKHLQTGCTMPIDDCPLETAIRELVTCEKVMRFNERND